MSTVVTSLRRNMYLVTIALLVSLAILPLTWVHAVDVLSDDYINYINNHQSTWKAGRNFDKSISLSTLQGMMGLLESEKLENVETMVHEIGDDTVIPESFDAREAWPNCASIKEIQDQAACGSCWAVAGTSSMNDRICIHSNGTVDKRLSAIDVVSCCPDCGQGCGGGVLIGPWRQWFYRGIVTGGEYNSSTGCKDYPFAPCGTSCTGSDEAPECKQTCDADSATDYKTDLSFARRFYWTATSHEQIQLEIMTNGPTATGFDVFTDFIHYKSGVYIKTNGTNPWVGRHAVRMVGWGVENDVPYWLLSNSWGPNWGENGFFKFFRGEQEHCGITAETTAGLPKF